MEQEYKRWYKEYTMGGNVLSRCPSLILIVLVFAPEGGEGDLFSKIGIDPMKGEKGSGFFFERLKW
jgi:hypothetical protein